MENKDLKSIADIARNMNALHFFPQLVNPAIESQRLINEIATITKTIPNEVIEFSQSHNLSLEYIKQVVLLCGVLDIKEMEKSVVKQLSPTPFKELAKMINEVLPKPTLKERILSIPYHFAYYLSYPFLWLAYQLWDGIEDAYLNSWDKE